MTDRAEISQQTRTTAQWLGVLAWGLFGLMAVQVAGIVRGRIGDLEPAAEGWGRLVNQFGVGLVEALPSIFLLFALLDFARLFGRCGDGHVFTEQNVKTLRSGGDSLILAAASSALISPTLVEWITGDPGGFRFQVNDLALGVGALGLAIHGLALIFRDAVAIKRENDEIV